MTKVRLPKSTKKYLRKEKARIRAEILDTEKQNEKLQELFLKFYPSDKSSPKLKNQKRSSKKPS